MNKATGTLTVGNLLTVAARRFHGRTMLRCVTTGRSFTFGEANTRVNRLANGLSSFGVRKGDCVAFLCNNRAELVETYFALAKLGAVGMPINYRLSTSEIADLLQLSEAGTLIFAPRFAAAVEGLHTGADGSDGHERSGLRCIAIGEEVPGFAQGYEELLEGSSPEEPGTVVTEEDPQYFNLTSGTTGSPKTYLLNHYNNALAGTLMAGQFDLTGTDVVLTVFPMFGRVGFGWTLAAVYSGLPNVIMDFEPWAVAAAIQDEKCTIVNLVPTMAQMLMGLDDIEARDLSSLRGIVYAGAPLPTPVHEATVRQLCPHVYEYYGMQETGVVVDIKPEEKRTHPTSVGRVSPFCEVRAVDPEGNDVPAGENGAIIVQAPTSTTGYYRNPEKSRETFRDGWIHTGDIGRFDEDGFLYITGRAKDVIVTGGQNVFATEVEDLLLRHPGVADCSVIGLADEFWGERVTAVVVAAPGAEVTEEALIEYCRQSLAGFKTPKAVLFRTDPIPRTPTGKVTKYSLLEEYAPS